MLNWAKSLVQSVAGVASEDFNGWVEARSEGQEHAPFFEGGFAEAVEAAGLPGGQTGGRGLVLLWLHEREDDVTSQLCTRVWPHAGVRSELRTRFVPWAGDVFRYEASTLARALRARTHPTLVVIERVPRGTPGSVQWPRGTYFNIMWMQSGHIDGDGLHALLVDLAETLETSRRQEAEWRQQMRQMQEMGRSLMRNLAEAQAEAERKAVRDQGLRVAETDERSCFAAIFESKYACEPPPFFDGAFDEALAAARSSKKLLLVWLYGSNPEDDALCREVLVSESEVFKAFVDEYFVMWPGDAEHWLLPVQLRELLRIQTVPVLLVMQPLSVYEATILPWGEPRSGSPVEFPVDSAWSLLGLWDVTVSGTAEDEIMAFLAEHGDRAMEKEREREQQRQRNRELADQARALREQQDREFEESLQADRMRGAATTAEDDSRAELVQPTPAEAEALALRLAKEKEIEAKNEVQRRGRREQAQRLLDAAPPEGARCELVLRLPNGRRSTKTFGADAPLSQVYAWATCAGELCDLQGGDWFDVPEHFTLATTYPRAVLRDPEDANRSLRDLGLVPNAVIALCPVES